MLSTFHKRRSPGEITTDRNTPANVEYTIQFNETELKPKQPDRKDRRLGQGLRARLDKKNAA